MYRHHPPLAKLAPRASLWRRFLAWRNGTLLRIELRRVLTVHRALDRAMLMTDGEALCLRPRKRPPPPPTALPSGGVPHSE